MLLKLRGQVEDVVRDVVREILASTNPATSQAMPADPIQQPPSTERREWFDRL